MVLKTIKQYSKVKIIKVREDLDYTLGKGLAEVGDIGSVVEIYKTQGLQDGYEVECVQSDATTKWMATFYLEELEPCE